MVDPKPTVMRSHLGKARGLGSARSGVSHWWAQRMTAFGLVPLILYCLIGFLICADSDLAVARGWLQSPVNAVAMILTLAAGFYHAALGVQVVIEDYVSAEALKLLLLVANNLIMIALATLSVFSVLVVALGGG